MNMVKRWTPFEASAIGEATLQKQETTLAPQVAFARFTDDDALVSGNPLNPQTCFNLSLQDTRREAYVKAFLLDSDPQDPSRPE